MDVLIFIIRTLLNSYLELPTVNRKNLVVQSMLNIMIMIIILHEQILINHKAVMFF